MAARHLLLTALGLAVTGAGVHLAIEVRASPSVAVPAPVAVRRDEPAEPAERGTPSDPTVAAQRTRELARNLPGVDRGRTTESTASAESTPPASTEPPLADVMAAANTAYDRQEFEEAKQIAAQVIARDPTNVRMLRVLVSTSCIEGSPGDAQKYFDMLPLEGADRAQMRTRCQRDYNITLK